MPADGPSIHLTCHNPAAWDAVFAPTAAWMKRYCLSTLAQSPLTDQEKGNLAQREISFLLTDNAEMQTYNKTYRNVDRPTNVLAFPAEIPPALAALSPNTPLPLGDIVLALETIQSEATEQERTFEDHLAHLVIHGFLHLLGFDHIDAQDALEMEAIEINALAMQGIPNPYTSPTFKNSLCTETPPL